METEAAIVRRTFKQVWIGATVCAVAFGATVAASALTYVTTFPTVASRRQLAVTTGGDTGLAVLLGPVSTIDTVGGYTVYKCFVFLTTVGAIWAILATTRLLRGEEDTGRWQLVLSGSTRASRATVATLAGLEMAVVVVFCGTTSITMLAGRDRNVGFGVGETVLYGLSITIAPAAFVAVGALTSQLSRTRRMATGLGIAVFGVASVVRMIADSGPTTHWLRWLTPFGWTELVRPFTHNDPWPLVPAGATVLGLCAAATVLASRRDAGEGVVASRDVSPLRAFGLGSPLALAARLELAVLATWCAGAAATGFAFGIIAKVTTGNVPPSLRDTLDKFGVQGSFADQYLGVAFLLVATVVALLPAGQIGAAFDEEASGRLANVLVQPTVRTALLGGRLAVSAAAIAVAGLLAGVGAWLGAQTQGIDLGLASTVEAGLNVVPTALVALGVGAVALAVAPRAAATVVYGLVVASTLFDLLGSIVAGLSWLDRLSLFHYMALAPAQVPRLATLMITAGIAVALCGAATVLFARRDLHSSG